MSQIYFKPELSRTGDAKEGRLVAHPVQPASASGESVSPSVFLFNPYAEAHISEGKAFTPTKHQAQLAADLSNLPQFLGTSKDIVLVPEIPSSAFLEALARVGLPVPDFVQLAEGRIETHHPLRQRRVGALRPWAWAPDSAEVLQSLAGCLPQIGLAEARFSEDIAKLYSKVWSLELLKEALPLFGGAPPWICSEAELGIEARTLEDALNAVSTIRRRGYLKVVLKEAFGQAGHNAIRLWESEISLAQRKWLTRALSRGHSVVVEPWLDRVLDFSVQMEKSAHGLEIRGFTGLLNDLKGQFVANWAGPDHRHCLPEQVRGLFDSDDKVITHVLRFYDQVCSLMDAKLDRAGFRGPISIDAFVYRTAHGQCRLKPIVEINPRYTMGRLTLELMKHVSSGSSGLFRLVNRSQAGAAGFSGLSAYARHFVNRSSIMELGELGPKIREGAVCLNDPQRAGVCLATFEVGPSLEFPPSAKA